MNLAKSNRLIKEFREHHNLKHLSALDEIVLEAFLNFLEKYGYLAEGDEVSGKVYDMMIEGYSKMLDDMHESYLNKILILLDTLSKKVYSLSFNLSNYLSLSHSLMNLQEYIRDNQITYKRKLNEFKKIKERLEKAKKEMEE